MATRTIILEAGSIEELMIKARAKNFDMPAGSSGRYEIYGRKFLGICTTPIGFALGTPFVGQRLADYFSPTGMIVTAKGGLGGFGPDCDGFIEWRLPIRMALGDGIVDRLTISVVNAIAPIFTIIRILGWAIGRIKAIFRIVLEEAIALGKSLLPILAVGIALVLAFKAFSSAQGQGKKNS